MRSYAAVTWSRANTSFIERTPVMALKAIVSSESIGVAGCQTRVPRPAHTRRVDMGRPWEPGGPPPAPLHAPTWRASWRGATDSGPASYTARVTAEMGPLARYVPPGGRGHVPLAYLKSHDAEARLVTLQSSA